MRTVHYRAQQYDGLGEFEAFMGAPTEPDSMGGLVHVVIGAYHGLTRACYSHVFAFVVVQPFRTCRILACDLESFSPSPLRTSFSPRRRGRHWNIAR